jgi:hypothetical protein
VVVNHTYFGMKVVKSAEFAVADFISFYPKHLVYRLADGLWLASWDVQLVGGEKQAKGKVRKIGAMPT